MGEGRETRRETSCTKSEELVPSPVQHEVTTSSNGSQCFHRSASPLALVHSMMYEKLLRELRSLRSCDAPTSSSLAALPGNVHDDSATLLVSRLLYLEVVVVPRVTSECMRDSCTRCGLNCQSGLVRVVAV